MRIRRRPLLLSLSSCYSSSSSLNPNPSFQQPQEEGRRSELHPFGDLTSDPPLHQDLLSKSKQSQMHRVLDDSFSQQSLVTSDNSGQSSGAKALLMGSEWCNGNGDGIKDGSFDLPEKDGSFDGKGGKKKRSKSPAVLMEGSRCSRVNGRGWRCSQQTLVGYSLCEHHLGKGRLRSMSIVRRGQSSSGPKRVGSEGSEDDAGSGSGERKGRRKKKKMGTILKARSIGSLLDDTDHLAAATLTSLALSTLDSGNA